MTTLFRQPGLRPAQGPPALPPTLQPHAVLSLAPPTDRVRSAAFSAAVYVLLGGGVFLLARTGAAIVQRPPVHMGPVVIIDPMRPAVVPAMPHVVATPKLPTVPVVAPPVTPATNLDTSSTLPQVDHSTDLPATTLPNAVTDNTASTDSGPISISMDALRVLHQVDPAYPPLAKMSHLQGQVVLRMTIDDQGVPFQIEAISGPQVFQGPAQQAARQWRFEAARQNGQAVPATFLLTLNFVLK